MKTNLIKLFAQKEVIWFCRMKEMKTKMNWVAFIIAVILQFIGQHAFALMHFMFESVLFFVNKPMFKRNLRVMNEKLEIQKVQYGLKKPSIAKGGETIKYESSITYKLQKA